MTTFDYLFEDYPTLLDEKLSQIQSIKENSKISELERFKKVTNWLYNIKYDLYEPKKIIKYDKNGKPYRKYLCESYQTLEKLKYGMCFDTVNWLYNSPKMKEFKNNATCLFMCPDESVMEKFGTHAVYITKIKNKYYWAEFSWSEHIGIHEYSSLNSAISHIKKLFETVEKKNDSKIKYFISYKPDNKEIIIEDFINDKIKKATEQSQASHKNFTLEERIIKKGSKWQVTDHTGTKNLGTYDTKTEAEERLKQVEYFKHKNA